MQYISSEEPEGGCPIWAVAERDIIQRRYILRILSVHLRWSRFDHDFNDTRRVSFGGFR